MSRRIAAVVLPHLLSELASPLAPKHPSRPFGIILHDRHDMPPNENARLDAVDENARQLGLRDGLTIAEAHAFVATVEIRTVTRRQVQDALARVAEVAFAFSPSVGLTPPDTVHLDLTGAAHLAGGEESLIESLRSRVEGLGHMARVAVASGPRIAAALARYGSRPATVVPPGHDAIALQSLPVSALPIDDDDACWLMRVGVVTVKDLACLPRNQVAARLADRAADVMMLISGYDPTPLTQFDPPDALFEDASWDEGIEQLSALLFVLNRLTARLSARLQGRGQALCTLTVAIEHDRSISRLRQVEEITTSRLELPAPIDRADDLLRAIRARLERVQLSAPVVGLRLEASTIVPAPRIQLDLSRDTTASPDALPVLLAELSAELGPERVGTLTLVDAHRPETRSVLAPVVLRPSPRRTTGTGTTLGADVTRLIASPLPLGRLKLAPGSLITVERFPAMEIRHVHFDARIDDLEWWTSRPASRDYFRVWLRGDPIGSFQTAAGGTEAWIYRDRARGDVYLHGWLD